MQLFKRSGKARKKWHRKAWLIDPNRTIITLVSTATSRPKHVPPWVYKRELDPSIQEMYAMSSIRKQYCTPLCCPIGNATETPSGIREEALPF
jgi:hypothetical protein